MNRELILEYAAKTERLGVPESWEATGPRGGAELRRRVGVLPEHETRRRDRDKLYDH